MGTIKENRATKDGRNMYHKPATASLYKGIIRFSVSATILLSDFINQRVSLLISPDKSYLQVRKNANGEFTIKFLKHRKYLILSISQLSPRFYSAKVTNITQDSFNIEPVESIQLTSTLEYVQ